MSYEVEVPFLWEKTSALLLTWLWTEGCLEGFFLGVHRLVWE